MKHNWFSNFLPFDVPMDYQGLKFTTVEHFYQAMKCEKNDTVGRTAIANAATPDEAKRLGKMCALRADWEDVKEAAMMHALRYKFTPGTSWHKKLVASTEDLVEFNYWHDRYWGRCTCPRCGSHGKNRLGILLMILREELKNANSTKS